MKRLACMLLALLSMVIARPGEAASGITIAAAADLKFAMDGIVARFRQAMPGSRIEVIYGSSGKFHAQIRQGAPYDLFFSADIAFPRALAAEGLAASDVRPYAVGRLALWSPSRDARGMALADLADPSIRRIAIANPKHAPYGRRAEEALRAAGVWEKVASKLVFGENVAQAAQYVQTGNADVGILALSLALSPELAGRGGHALVPDHLHPPLEQGFIVTKRAAGNALAGKFADFMESPEARAILNRHGFALPGEMGK
ncbi:MAG: molybdate ABC transporter substrate-binding protein [Rhodocyclaceae bacterium]|nr:molybdate ABC transporter substrate-binding protein [Rhodocyclaceae bacterium]